MTERVFLSFASHRGDWVRQRLIPCLKAAGLRAVVRRGRRMRAPWELDESAWDPWLGERRILAIPAAAVRGGGDAPGWALVLEEEGDEVRALAELRRGCALPSGLRPAVAVDLTDDSAPAPWDALLGALGGHLGCPAPDWLAARDAILGHLIRGDSVYLREIGDAPCRSLLDHLHTDHFPGMAILDFSRMGGRLEDLMTFTPGFFEHVPMILALAHYDLLPLRDRSTLDAFADVIPVMDRLHLRFVIHSRAPRSELLAPAHPLAAMPWQTVELAGRGGGAA